jgi:serine/threonine protein kinase
MSLTAGTRIGPYEISSQIGEGGMGIVFRAHDTKLQRDVALKLLPDHFADDPERRSLR